MSGLVDRHISFLEALRAAGMSVSLAEDLDAVAALSAVAWDRREVVRTAYAATLVKKQSQRPTFDTLFDVYFPRMVGDGVAREQEPDADRVQDNAAALAAFRDDLVDGLAEGDRQAMLDLAAEMLARFGAMPGRGPGLSSWSAYTALQRVSPQELVDRIAQALQVDRPLEDARVEARRRVGELTGLVEADARRRIAEEKGPEHIAQVAVRPSIDRLDFTAARKSDLEQMGREIYPLARRLATRLTQEHHARRRGPLDFRRTVRASISTGGVPLVTHHKPKRPHRTELVVLCDVSGSVASFAQFTLLLVYALREHFASVRAFTFIDHVHEVTHHFRPGADPGDVLADLAASTAHAALWGRTNYGRALTKFEESYADALGPKSSLLILGDARSNYADLHVDVLQRLAGSARHSWWLNPEHRRHWDTGDSAASRYGAVVPMVECRNLTQLGGFVHDIL
ncbi:VWA domain-containing protein [Nocardioides sp. MAH-18]|uniref:VWA domain-containing protein n=1 Tax=Nocardioides agri TaxID=2682843 RepID=A0A6L6XS21_9ACTN|nr:MULTISPECIES: VWA domain-containing protein [unclassified Nocardioides]MBA2955340.1 VWA domain-containing protein [Nocardioides sp. CGMCC 1.13656]MVQ50191.1 VWA domain-containing protein [Nocardioides sp. MAH-18]